MSSRICRRSCIHSRRSGRRHRAVGPSESAFAELFTNRWFILTPLPAPSRRGGAARALLARLRLQCREMTPEHHDIVLAITSHLPHLIAFDIVATAADLEEVTNSEVISSRPAASATSPHRRLRSHHVARRLPQRQGRRARDARPFLRGPSVLQRAIRWATATLCSICSPARARSCAASSPPGRKQPARFRPTAAGRRKRSLR